MRLCLTLNFIKGGNMSLYKRKNSQTWWVDLTTNSGTRIREATGTTNKVAAQKHHDKRVYELRYTHNSNSKPKLSWKTIVMQRLKDNFNKLCESISPTKK